MKGFFGRGISERVIEFHRGSLRLRLLRDTVRDGPKNVFGLKAKSREYMLEFAKRGKSEKNRETFKVFAKLKSLDMPLLNGLLQDLNSYFGKVMERDLKTYAAQVAERSSL